MTNSERTKEVLVIYDVTFPVNISNGGYIEIVTVLSDKEYKLLMTYKENYDNDSEDSEEFCDVEKLSDLYERICSEAYDEMANGCLTNPGMIEYAISEDERDFDTVRNWVEDNFELLIDYPEE